MQRGSLAKQIWLGIRNTLALVGVGSILTAVSHIDAVQHWLANPTLEVEILSFVARRETSSFSREGPVFDEVKIRLNVIPQVRFHVGSLPVNQIRSLAVEKKGKGFLGYRVEPSLPQTVREEPRDTVKCCGWTSVPWSHRFTL